MANKRWSDVSPSKGDKDSRKDASYPTGSAKPGNPKNFEAPSHTRGGTPTKGGKGLPVPTFTEQKHWEPSAKLPKDGK